MHKRIFIGIGLGLAALSGCASGPKWLRIQSPDSGGKGIDSYVKGAEAYESGNRDAAVAALQTAIQSNPNLITPRILLGGIYRKESDYKDALVQYEALADLDPYTASNHYYLGLCYQLVDRLSESVVSYKRALKLAPNDADSHMNLGLVYLTLGKLDDAVAQTRQATELAPQSAAAWGNYAVALDTHHDYKNAESAYRKSLELDSSQPTTLINLATNLLLQDRPSDAATLFEQAVPKQDSALGRKRWGDALLASKKFDAAVRQYQAALKLNPRYFPAYNGLGEAYVALYRAGYELEESQRQSALDAWRKSLEINPNQPAIRKMLTDSSTQPLFK